MSTLQRVGAEGCGSGGFFLNGAAHGSYSTVNTSITFLSCYAVSSPTGIGYNIVDSTYTTLQGCAADSNGTGYAINGSTAITLNGCGAEYSTSDTSSPGNSYEVSGGSSSVGLYNCYSLQNKSIALWVTGISSAVTAIGFQEGTPNSSATSSIKVDSGSSTTLSDPLYITATTLSGTVLWLGDNHGNVIVPSSLSTSGFSGGLAVKTSSYSAKATDNVILGNSTSGSLTITLPDATKSHVGQQYVIKKIDSSANTITVATTSSQTIDGTSSLALNVQYEAVEVATDGSNWYVIGQVATTIL